MARKRDSKMTDLVAVRLKPETTAVLDQWRREQLDLPNRAEAIRRLMVKGLEQERAEKPGKGKKS
jgi:hypothetical protein